jgi:hypothetical protein
MSVIVLLGPDIFEATHLVVGLEGEVLGPFLSCHTFCCHMREDRVSTWDDLEQSYLELRRQGTIEHIRECEERVGT